MGRVMVFDGQVFQTDAWDRGMGKYSLCLVDSILNHMTHTDMSVYLVFTKHLPLSADAKRVLKKLGPKVKHIYLDLHVPKSHDVTQHIANRSQNVVTLDNFIDTVSGSNNSVSYIILSLFIGDICEVFPSKTENILLFYDLIPLFYYEYYGKFSTYGMYLSQFRSLMAADKIMTISQTVADELSGFLGIPRRKLCNIDGGPIKRNHIKALKPTSFVVPDKFLLMPTGNDMRKNNKRAVQGFEECRLSNNDSSVYLIITSTFDEATREELSSYSDHLIFTGNIPEEELLWLYRHMDALLFIPESEGLGLPILEATEAGRPIICSKIGPFFEMSESAFYYANQFDISDIANTIAEASSGYRWSEKSAQYPSIIDKYQWSETATKAVNFINQPSRKKKSKKPRLAILGPDPSGYSAIGKIMEQSHPTLSEYFDIEYYIEKQKSGNLVLRPSYIEYIASSRPVEQFDANAYAQYDYVIYHVGNSEFHIETIKKALHLPGYIIAHDTDLGDIFSLMHSSGVISGNRYEAEKRVDKVINADTTKMIGSLLSNQLGAFVHSDFAKNALESLNMHGVEVMKTVLATDVPLRANPRLSPKITVGLAGIIHPIKGMDIIRRMAQQPEFENVQFEVFGMAMASQEDIDKLSVLPNINISTNLTDYQFQLKLSQLDIIVNYREDYHGETSLSVIEAMKAGVVPVVHGVGWYAELPDDIVVKLKSSKHIAEVISKLINDPTQIHKRSERAKQYVGDTFTHEVYSKNIIDMLAVDRSEQSEKQQIVTALKAGDIEKVLNIVRQDPV